MTDFPILYEDAHLIVCLKPAGVLSEAQGLPAMIARHRDPDAPEDRLPYVGTVHRLDREVSGVMVYAYTAEAAAALSAMAADGRMQKEYIAVLCGEPEEAGSLKDLLFHDRVRNKTYVVDRKRRGVKEASLSYRILARARTEQGMRSLALICLHTGRTHQIRIQFGSRKFPVVGDPRYGGGKGKMALFSRRLSFPHPASGKMMSFEALPVRIDAWADFPAEVYKQISTLDER